ncbi:MAG: RNA polymerase-binding protein DksA [Desulfofustis sp.]
MDNKLLENFKKQLVEKRQEILSEADKTLAEMTDQNSNVPDPNDRATIESDRSFELRIRDRERKLLSKIEDALIRIDEGEYGICEECGCDINVKRLEARPVTTLCIDCRKKRKNHRASNLCPNSGETRFLDDGSLFPRSGENGRMILLSRRPR